MKNILYIYESLSSKSKSTKEAASITYKLKKIDAVRIPTTERLKVESKWDSVKTEE